MTMSLDWTLEIHDKISAPSLAAASALKTVVSSLRANESAIGGATTASERLAAAKGKLAAASRASATAAKAESDAIVAAQRSALAAADRSAAGIRTANARTAAIGAKLTSDVHTASLDAFLVGKNKGKGTYASGASTSAGPAAPSGAVKMLQGLEKALPGSIANISKFTDAWDKVSPVLQAVAGPAKVAAGALLALGAVTVGAALGATKMLFDAQSFKQDTMFAFEHILKSKAAAKSAFDMAAKTSFEVGADFKQSMAGMNVLLAQGFKADFADQLLRAMGDLKTLNPQANLEGIVRALSQIKTTGHLQGDELMQLAEAGLNVQSVYEQIGKSMKLTAKSGSSVMDQVQKLQSGGKISADTAIAAVMASIKAQTGQEFGSVAAEKADKTLAGALARAENLKEQLLSGAKVNWTPLSKALGRLNEVLQSKSAKAFFDAVGGQLSRVFKLADGVSKADMASVFEMATKAVIGFGDAIAAAWKIGAGLVDIARVVGPNFQVAWMVAKPALEMLGAEFGFVGDIIGGVVADARQIASAISSALGPLAELVSGFSSAAGAARDAAGASGSITSGLGGKVAGGIAHGMFGVGGLLLGGARAGGGPVESGTSYLVGEQGPELFTPRGSGQIMPSADLSSLVTRAGQRIAQSIINTSSVDNSRHANVGAQYLIFGGNDGPRSAEDAARMAVESWA